MNLGNMEPWSKKPKARVKRMKVCSGLDHQPGFETCCCSPQQHLPAEGIFTQCSGYSDNLLCVTMEVPSEEKEGYPGSSS